MKRYKVFDVYNFNDYCIGYADTLKEVKKLARAEYDETDGECLIYYVELDPVIQKYDHATCRLIEVI